MLSGGIDGSSTGDLGSGSVGEGFLHAPHGGSQWKRQSFFPNCLLVIHHEKWTRN